MDVQIGEWTVHDPWSELKWMSFHLGPGLYLFRRSYLRNRVYPAHGRRCVEQRRRASGSSEPLTHRNEPGHPKAARPAARRGVHPSNRPDRPVSDGAKVRPGRGASVVISAAQEVDALVADEVDEPVLLGDAA